MSIQRPFRTACLFALLFVATIVSAGNNWEYLVKTYPLLGDDNALSQTFNKLGMQQWILLIVQKAKPSSPVFSSAKSKASNL